jgi:hypothetical protein
MMLGGATAKKQNRQRSSRERRSAALASCFYLVTDNI